MKVTFSIYRYNANINHKPYIQNFNINIQKNLMVLDALLELKDKDPSLSFRYACREGVCGSDGMNINGRNKLACITPIEKEIRNTNKIIIRPLPGFPIIKDLIVNMKYFFRQYTKIKPWLVTKSKTVIKHENLQDQDERNKLDGLYECILCACCSAACPSFWWNPDKFIGPAGLLTAYRFLSDSRDTNMYKRLKMFSDHFRIFRCKNIMSCVDSCPKKLNPALAISKIKLMILKDTLSKKKHKIHDK